MFNLKEIIAILLIHGAVLVSSTLGNTSGTAPYARDASTGYGTITTTTQGNVTRAVFNNPPIQLYDYKVTHDFYDFLIALNSTTRPPKVVIFASADPDIFVTHFDSNAFFPETPPEYSTGLISLVVQTVQMLRHLPTIFIGEINGLATGAGNEFAVQLDMRFAGPNARLGALEVGVGVLHGNGGNQYLTQLIGPGRAAEYLMGVKDVDAKTAEAYGWVNRAYGSGAELTQEVNKLAQRIALFPADALNATKVSIRANGPSEQSLLDDLDSIARLSKGEQTQNLLRKFLVLGENQTRTPFELGLDDTIAELYQ